MEHGKVSGYSSGCRCDACRAAIAEYMRDSREKRRVARTCAECGRDFMALPDSHYGQQRQPGSNRFCSRACAGIAAGSGVRPVVIRRGHPIAGPDGRIAIHRIALFEKIGPGVHHCHWCGREVTWMSRRRTQGDRERDLVADHHDGNCQNNDPGNLVPSCNFCNVLRGWVWKWERLTGRPIGEMSPQHEA